MLTEITAVQNNRLSDGKRSAPGAELPGSHGLPPAVGQPDLVCGVLFQIDQTAAVLFFLADRNRSKPFPP